VNEQEVFSMFERIETKLDTISQKQQDRCDIICIEQRKQIDSKLSVSIFKWVTSFIIGGVVSLALFMANIDTKISVLYSKHIKNLKEQELKVGDINGIPSVSSNPRSGENP
jgi:hypothetical protein